MLVSCCNRDKLQFCSLPVYRIVMKARQVMINRLAFSSRLFTCCHLVCAYVYVCAYVCVCIRHLTDESICS